ncbi:MAG: hypothetical protein V4502_08155 [Pseudomonadota bacterium]
MTFTSVNKDQLRRAFAIAHRAGEDPQYPQATRVKFKAIATLLWKAHGEEGDPPQGSGAKILDIEEAAS